MTFAALTKQDDGLSTRTAWRWTQRAEWGVALASLVLAWAILSQSHDDAFGVCVAAPAITALVTWIVVQDLKTFTIADGAVVSLAVLATALRWASGDSILRIGVDCVLTGGLLLAFREIYYRRKGFDGLGLGDVKLSAAGGILVGATGFAWALLAASLLALGFVAMGRLAVGSVSRTPLSASDRLAFGAVLAPAIWAAWIVQLLPIFPSLIGP